MGALWLWVIAILAGVALFCTAAVAYGRWIDRLHIGRRDRKRYAEEKRLLAAGDLPVTWTKTYETVVERDADTTRMLGLGYRSENVLAQSLGGTSDVVWVRHHVPEAGQSILTPDT
jgi:hypothetical protein